MPAIVTSSVPLSPYFHIVHNVAICFSLLPPKNEGTGERGSMTKLPTVKTDSQKLNMDVRPRTLGLSTLATVSLLPTPFWLTSKNIRFLLA